MSPGPDGARTLRRRPTPRRLRRSGPLPRDGRLHFKSVRKSTGPGIRQQAVPEVPRRNRPRREKALVEVAQGEAVPLEGPHAIAQVEYVALAQVVGDGLRRPLRVPVDGAPRAV